MKIGKPYQVGGVWYYPKDDRDYEETGIASWYGPGFHGKPTATGERYDMDGITAAHKTLPLPSFVEVTNLRTGRKQLVRVNDRGPFVGDRIIDLSRRTAQMLELDRAGLAKVRVRRVYPSEREIAAIMPRNRAPVMLASAPVPRTTPRPAAVRPPLVAPVPTPVAPPVVRSVELPGPAMTADLFIQVAALLDQSRADALASELRAIATPLVERSPAGFFRVKLGPFASSEAAHGALAQVHSAGYGDARVVGAPAS